MSGISDYSALLMDAGDYSGNNGIAHLTPRFVGLAETKLNRVLRVGAMEKSAVVTLVTGDGDLPDDFIEMRQTLSADGRNLRSWSLQELSSRFQSFGGNPIGYAVVGNQLRVRPTTDGDIGITYYAKLPGLTLSNPTNWLLTSAPDVYLYAVVEEIAIWERDAEKAGSAKALKDQAIFGLRINDERARWGNGQVVIGEPTP
ncbi:phage adaptor protein [Pararhizobium sp. DWP1-1-3]|uniref:phage adaptor protein n=1 Tax=Pararhizobium sp. DWP1-1-3 TaxID=2804652 RepID=UPI003CF7241F